MRSRDELAARFETLAGTYGERLLGYLLRRVPADDAPDIAAEALMTAWRRLRVMPEDDEQAFWWLLAIARRTVANHRRGTVRRSALAERLRALPLAVAPEEDSDAVLLLREGISRLSDDDRELVRLVYWDGLRIQAAAVVLGIGEAAARKRLQRIRERLRAGLEADDDARQTV